MIEIRIPVGEGDDQSSCWQYSAKSGVDTLVLLRDTSHDGEMVTVSMNGAPLGPPVAGKMANFTEPSISGAVIVRLAFPSGSEAAIVLDCP